MKKTHKKLTYLLILVLALVVLIQAQIPAVRPSSMVQKQAFIADAVNQTNLTDKYDPTYVKLKYPGGDVPLDRGACSDVIIRALRKTGVDLQKEIHEDMSAHFKEYPQKWGMKQTDSNIDHRRVLNLMKYFQRQGKQLPLTRNYTNYQPGDIVAWDLGNGTTHIGIVTSEKNMWSRRNKVVHNIGYGTKLEDVLFDWKIIGHYRYF